MLRQAVSVSLEDEMYTFRGKKTVSVLHGSVWQLYQFQNFFFNFEARNEVFIPFRNVHRVIPFASQTPTLASGCEGPIEIVANSHPRDGRVAFFFSSSVSGAKRCVLVVIAVQKR